jgi:hypothetical protein
MEINIERIKDRITILKMDERLMYKAATVFENAPLALVQIQLITELHTLQRVLGLEPSKIPLRRKKS